MFITLTDLSEPEHHIYKQNLMAIGRSHIPERTIRYYQNITSDFDEVDMLIQGALDFLINMSVVMKLLTRQISTRDVPHATRNGYPIRDILERVGAHDIVYSTKPGDKFDFDKGFLVVSVMDVIDLTIYDGANKQRLRINKFLVFSPKYNNISVPVSVIESRTNNIHEVLRVPETVIRKSDCLMDSLLDAARSVMTIKKEVSV